jgi:hypothetical protein
MQELVPRRVRPELRKLVCEASQALALLDAERLEELALSCAALSRDLESADPKLRKDLRNELGRQALNAQEDMAIFGRVLDATRANLAVIHRIRDLRVGSHLEYAPRRREGSHGDH